jgi:CheY-like chemotaxis protein
MVIVDEQRTSDRLAALVRQWGHDPHSVDNGLSALRMAVITRPNVVLLCGGTSLTNRCELARRIRIHLASQDCLIIAITGQVDQQHRQQCIEAGIDLVLSTAVDSAVVETLLLLECTRLNRFAVGNGGGHRGLKQNLLEQGELEC